jgi:hypothetical protein
VTSFVECGLERFHLPLNFVLLEVKIDHLFDDLRRGDSIFFHGNTLVILQ